MESVAPLFHEPFEARFDKRTAQPFVEPLVDSLAESLGERMAERFTEPSHESLAIELDWPRRLMQVRRLTGAQLEFSAEQR